MTVLLAVFVVVTFAVTIDQLSLADRAREVGARSSDALGVLRDPALTDDRKEEALQRESIVLFKLLGVLAGGSLLALLVPLAVVWLLGQLGVSSLGEVLDVLERLDFLAAVTIVGTALFLIRRRLRSE